MTVIRVVSTFVGAALVLGACGDLEERRRSRPRLANQRQLSNLRRRGRPL